MVHPIASLAHRSPAQVGENPETFDGRRWVDKGKPATMTGPGHLAFGLGRWACPGRYLAVSGEMHPCNCCFVDLVTNYSFPCRTQVDGLLYFLEDEYGVDRQQV